MKLLVSIATAAFIFPLTILPDAPANCANSAWQFAVLQETPENYLAAELARDEFCRVVTDNVAMWN